MFIIEWKSPLYLTRQVLPKKESVTCENRMYVFSMLEQNMCFFNVRTECVFLMSEQNMCFFNVRFQGERLEPESKFEPQNSRSLVGRSTNSISRVGLNLYLETQCHLRGDCKPYPHNVNFRNIFSQKLINTEKWNFT